jgi:hypothetical protein
MTDLNKIRDVIENMSHFNQIEILRILHKHKEVILNENKYGIHVNMSELSDEVIEQVISYVSYVNTQEMSLKQDEKQKEDFKNIYFSQKA